MMREIKFRAWDKDAEQMHDWYQLRSIRYNQAREDLKTDNHPVIDIFNSQEYDGTLMQFTGLQDKNGKDIYEGDILTPIAYVGLSKDKRFKCEVVFKKGMFCFRVKKPFITSSNPLYKSLNLGKNAGNDYVIIGNVHKNPELLEE